MVPTNGDVASPFGSLSLSPQAPEALLQRKEEYSRKLRENWQAERVHLEASRARAEEMFREERDIMDQERLLWAEHKHKLETEVVAWKQRAEAAEAEVARLTRLLQTDRGGGHIDDVGNLEQGHISSSSTSPGTGRPSNFTLRTPSDGVSPSDLPHGLNTTIPESNPFVPLDPRMQGVPQEDATAHEEPNPAPTRSININELYSELDGVQLRALAIQKSTFSDEKSAPPTVSPGHRSPVNPTECPEEPQPKVPSAVMTQEALQASEHRRLTMHAGHTPSHSMSLARLPIIEPIAEDTADSAEAPALDALDELKMAPVERKEDQNKTATAQEDYAAQDLDGGNDLPEEGILEPSDEAPTLKGPLCLRNRPVTDEIFLRRLSDKLEEVIATDASPSVLNEPNSPEPTEEGVPVDKPVPCVDDDTAEGLPLKFKNSSNFGQPLGQLRRTTD